MTSQVSPSRGRLGTTVEDVRVVELIQVRFITGAGTKEDKCRWVRQWWTKSGVMIAEHDPEDQGIQL